MTYTIRQALLDSEAKWKIIVNSKKGFCETVQILGKMKRFKNLKSDCGLCEFFHNNLNRAEYFKDGEYILDEQIC